MVEWLIESFNRTHERNSFCCGVKALDEFLARYVNQYEKRRLGRTYVLLQPPQKRVVGYYTLSAGVVNFQTVPRRFTKHLPKHPVPVILLARLAVNATEQGKGLGGLLLSDALRRSLELSEHLGVFAVEVDAANEAARSFYEKFGFSGLSNDRCHLFLPIATIEDAKRSDAITN